MNNQFQETFDLAFELLQSFLRFLPVHEALINVRYDSIQERLEFLFGLLELFEANFGFDRVFQGVQLLTLVLLLFSELISELLQLLS